MINPLFIADKIASKEFAKKFREIFTEAFGNVQPPVDDSKEDFRLKIIEEGVVDISNKDKAEVLAALYNNSHPHGQGDDDLWILKFLIYL